MEIVIAPPPLPPPFPPVPVPVGATVGPLGYVAVVPVLPELIGVWAGVCFTTEEPELEIGVKATVTVVVAAGA